MERAYDGRSISEVFEWFDEKPLASGSIAQVHKAVLNGDVVAVKVSSDFFIVECARLTTRTRVLPRSVLLLATLKIGVWRLGTVSE